ncbi:MAG: NADH-quinone oxidoreductase subunit A [Nitrospira sp. CG24B]|nr:MAG: NADH-quinone oxidoreductase subunit A [Nitrospira sp. CG24B]
MLGLPPLLGERHWKKSERRSESATGVPYECGIRPTGNAQVRPPVQYYLIAMFFVIFDVEAAYLYAWAVAVPETGWLGFIEVTIFVAIRRNGSNGWQTGRWAVMMKRENKQFSGTGNWSRRPMILSPSFG